MKNWAFLAVLLAGCAKAQIGVPSLNVRPPAGGGAAYVCISEAYVNGTNKLCLTAPTTLAGDTVVTLPSATTTVVNDPGANGIVARTAAGVTTARTITGTANEIAIANGDGVAAAPTLSIASAFDISGKTSTKPFKSGVSAPATCGVGEMYFKTDASAGNNLYLCTATNTWTQLLSGTGSGIPTGTVAYFNLAGCPTGWAEYTALRGRYAVGLPLSGTLNATVGTALTNIENRAVGLHSHTGTFEAHSHTLTDPGHLHTINASSTAGASGLAVFGSTLAGTFSSGSTTTGVTVDLSGSGNITVASAGAVAATNAPYIQLLACSKN